MAHGTPGVPLHTLHATLARALPGVDGGRLTILTAIACLAGHLVFRDRHYSREEAQRLRSALARMEWLEPTEREAVADLVESELQLTRRASRLAAELVLRSRLPREHRPQLWDALVDLGAASRSLRMLERLTFSFGQGVVPLDRATQLELEVGGIAAVAGLGVDTVRYDDEALRLGAGMHEVVVAWPVLERLEAVDPWPSLFLRWRERGYPGDALFRGTGDVGPLVQTLQHLFDHASARLGARAPTVIDRGWLDMADLEWETVSGFPEEPKPGHAGAYRTAAAARPDEPILARRGAPAPLERLLSWLASSPDTPWPEHVEEVLATDRYLYARRKDGAVARLPLWSLRTRLGDRDGVYVFGRRTRLVLPQRDAPCPVAQHLDGILRAR